MWLYSCSVGGLHAGLQQPQRVHTGQRCTCSVLQDDPWQTPQAPLLLADALVVLAGLRMCEGFQLGVQLEVLFMPKGIKVVQQGPCGACFTVAGVQLTVIQ